MNNENLFTGKLVRLVAADPDRLAEHFSRWSRDSEFFRLMGDDPSRPFSKRNNKEFFEKILEKNGQETFAFLIETVETGQVIGDLSIQSEISWTHGDAIVGIGLGEREFWGKGYGTEAMRLLLNYAFNELNLHRMSLDVFEYNPRAIRSYEKAGFVMEGRERQSLRREGQRWDIVHTGILRSEWETINREESLAKAQSR